MNRTNVNSILLFVVRQDASFRRPLWSNQYVDRHSQNHFRCVRKIAKKRLFASSCLFIIFRPHEKIQFQVGGF